MRRPLLLLLCLSVLLGSACVTTRDGPPPPSAAALEAQRKAELRYRAKTHTDLAAAYYSRNQFAVALEEVQEASNIDPNYVGAWNLRGLIYMALREDRESEDSFRQGVRVAPNDPELGNNYGYFLCTHGREREGLTRLDAVIRDPLYQTPEKPLVNAGLCALKLHDEAAAESYLRRAVSVQPTDPQGAYNLALIEDRQGHPGEARETLRPLLRAEQPSREVLDLLVDLDRRLSDDIQLREHGELRRKLYPDPAADAARNRESRP